MGSYAPPPPPIKEQVQIGLEAVALKVHRFLYLKTSLSTGMLIVTDITVTQISS